MDSWAVIKTLIRKHYCGIEGLIIVSLATGDKNIVLIINLVNLSVLNCDSSRPVTRLIKL